MLLVPTGEKAMNNCKLEKNMTLYCKNGETVMLVTFTDERLWVRYKGEVHIRPIEVINKTLFLENPLMEKSFRDDGKTDIFNLQYEKQSPIKNRENFTITPTVIEPIPKQGEISEKKSCINCRHQRSGECSSWDLCEDYQPIYVVADSEKNYWPTYGDATLFKRKSRKK